MSYRPRRRAIRRPCLICRSRHILRRCRWRSAGAIWQPWEYRLETRR